MQPRPTTIATLVHDSERGPHREGAGSLVRWRRRLVYGAGTVEIDLEIAPSKATGYLRMLGQVTTGELSAARVPVTTDGPTGHVQDETDDVGHFMFDRLLAADYRVTVVLSRRVIVLPWVPVRPRFPLDYADLVTALGLKTSSPRSDAPTDPPDRT